jgi:hypothetical protein
MTRETQETHFEDFTGEMKRVLFRKGNDYAGKDRLSNFKLAGAIINLTPEQQCLSLISTKVARLGNLINSQNPENESLHDSVLDLANYAVLLSMILKDKK